MTRPTSNRKVLFLVALGVAGLALSGFQVNDYPFNKSSPRKRPKLPERRRVYLEETEAQMREIMKKMCEEIGAKCEDCHNPKDFTAFEKPMKEFAQYKMLMLGWLNAKYRPENATWKYTCYTCHRGVLRPLPQGPPPKPGR